MAPSQSARLCRTSRSEGTQELGYVILGAHVEHGVTSGLVGGGRQQLVGLDILAVNQVGTGPLYQICRDRRQGVVVREVSKDRLQHGVYVVHICLEIAHQTAHSRLPLVVQVGHEHGFKCPACHSPSAPGTTSSPPTLLSRCHLLSPCRPSYFKHTNLFSRLTTPIVRPSSSVLVATLPPSLLLS